MDTCPSASFSIRTLPSLSVTFATDLSLHDALFHGDFCPTGVAEQDVVLNNEMLPRNSLALSCLLVLVNFVEFLPRLLFLQPNGLTSIFRPRAMLALAAEGSLRVSFSSASLAGQVSCTSSSESLLLEAV